MFFSVTGDDPYIVFQVQNDDEKKYLNIDLGNTLKDTELELFLSNNGDQFSPYFKAQFIVPSFPATLEIPAELANLINTKLRLDINNCRNCTVKLASPPNLVSKVENQLIRPSKSLNGIPNLSKDGKELIFGEWRLNHIKGNTRDFSVHGVDPFLVSPLFNFETSEIAGVYIDLKSPKSTEVYDDYQLFYQTERHGFTSSAKTTVRFARKELNNISFFIPLNFLRSGQPKDNLIKRIRLDLPLIDGNWSLKSAKLVHINELQAYESLIPEQLVNIKQQRASGLGIIKASIVKVLTDRTFSISYILFILIFIFFTRRAYYASI